MQSSEMSIKNAIKNNKHSKLIKGIIISLICLVLIGAICFASVMAISLNVKISVSNKIISLDEVEKLENVDYILVLGAGLKSDGSPSDMLADRLKTSFEVLKRSGEAKLIFSGDNSGESYNEVASMKKYAIDNLIDENSILTDGMGFSTFESVSRVASIFNAKKVIIITQEYHLYRALYIADKLGLDAYGVSADLRPYRGQVYRELREHAARTKDYFKVKNAQERD